MSLSKATMLDTGDLSSVPRGNRWGWNARGGLRQESEGLGVPLKPGNAGGGKEPWFGVCLDETRGGGLA